MRLVCLVSKEDKRCANSKPFAHPTLADFINDLVGKVTMATDTVRGRGVVPAKYIQQEILINAIGAVTKAQASSMVISPVKEDNFKNYNAGQRVKPIIWSIQGVSDPKSTSK